MSENVISVLSSKAPSGLSNSQFRRIDQLYCVAASKNILTHRTVDCDFGAGVMTIALSKSPSHEPALAFVANKVGPQTTMYELYMEGKGRVAKSALFERVFQRYRDEVEVMIEVE